MKDAKGQSLVQCPVGYQRNTFGTCVPIAVLPPSTVLPPATVFPPSENRKKKILFVVDFHIHVDDAENSEDFCFFRSQYEMTIS
jgi:hypothetical protein